MKTLTFKTHEDYAEYICRAAAAGKDITAVAFFDDVVKIIKELARYEDVIITDLEIARKDINGYTDEYCITLTSEKELFVEPAQRHGRYLNSAADIFVLPENVNEDIYDNIRADTYFKAVISNMPQAEQSAKQKAKTEPDITDNTTNSKHQCGKGEQCKHCAVEIPFSELFDFILNMI